jgi:copper resistance protein C
VRALGGARLAAVLLLVALCLRSPTVQAHTFPDHADPKVGVTVPTSPPLVRIWFDGALEPAFSSIMVHDDANRMVDKRDGHVDPTDPTLLEVGIPPLPAGVYRVYWEVVSRDGHRTSGDYQFTVQPAP